MSEIQGKVDAASRPHRVGRLSLMVVAAALLVLVSLTAACAGTDDNGTTEETLATMEARRGAQPTAPTTDGSPVASPDGSGSPVALPEGDPANGQTLATSLGCVACHSTDGAALTGPTWQGLYGHEVTLTDGSTLTADDEYIRESIVEPTAKVVEGYSPIMPSYASQVDDQAIADIIAYIKTLE